MSSIIANELDRFRHDISSIELDIANLEGIYNGLCNSVQSLNGMWEGGAHEMYQAQFINDDESMKLVFKNLYAFKKELDQAYRKFQTCEQNVENTIRSVEL